MTSLFRSAQFIPQGWRFRLRRRPRSRMKRAITLCTLLVACAVAAQSPSSKAELAAHLTKLLRFEGMFETYLKACTRPEGSPFDPKPEFESNPGGFGGISPQSAYWPEIEAIYTRFRNKTCAYATPEKFAAFFSERFAERLSAEDLHAAIAFHSSPVGRRIADATYGADQEFQSFANALMLESYEVARGDFQRDIRALLRKYKAEPK